MKLTAADRKKLLPQLDRLGDAVEELLLSGLTTASESTQKTLGVTFQEASRLRLLRLSGTLRVANEELGRFTRNDSEFSQRRLAFFLNRAWLLAKGIARALQEDDDAEFDRLMWMPPITKVDELRVVTIGIVKKVAAGAFCAFEFRLRSVDDGRSLIWSSVFPLKSGTSIPPEGFLHIPQKQKFTASIFLERKVVTLRDVGVMGGDNETGRIQLRDESTVTTGDELDDWDRFLQWDVAPAVERIQKHQPGPFDLDVEFQEEVVLSDWDISSPESRDDGKSSYPITVHGVVFNGQVSDGIEGKATHKALKNMINARQKPLLYGLMHYESCHLVLQPLAFFTDDGPEYITISQEAIDRKALLQTIKFT